MLTSTTIAGAGLLAGLILTLVAFLKPFLPAGLQGDQRDAAVRLLAVALGALGQTAVYLFTAAHVSRPDLGAALALGMASGYAAILGWHGGTAALTAVRQAPATAVPAPAVPPAAPAPSALEQAAAAGPVFPPAV